MDNTGKCHSSSSNKDSGPRECEYNKSREQKVEEGHEDESDPLLNDDAESLEEYEFISMSDLPEPNSEEIHSNTCTNVPVGLGAYLTKLGQTPLVTNISNLFPFTYIGTYFSEQISSSNAAETIAAFGNEMEEEVSRQLAEVTSLEDERRRRNCLAKALSDNCKEVIDKNVAGEAIEMVLLKKGGCVVKEDQLYLQGKSDDPVQRMRALFSMMLDRDLKTLLTFVWILKLRNVHLYENIISMFDHNMHTGFNRPFQCLQCVLIDRVNIRLIGDYLDINKWRKFYQKLSDAKLSESDCLWKEFLEDVNSRSLYGEVMPSLLRAIEACGFHSDILLMIKRDAEINVKKFECRCFEMRGDCEQTTYASQISDCEDAEESPKTLTVENCRNASVSNEAKGKYYSEEPKQNTNALNTFSDKVETENLQRQSTTLKRKNSDTGDAKFEGRQKKKAVERSGDKYQGDFIIRSEISTENSSQQAKSVESNVQMRNQEKKGQNGGKSLKDNSLDSLRMETLKVGVAGYDSEHDSGFSPDPSLLSVSDSGIYDQKTDDKHETIPKQFVIVLKPTASQNEAQAQSSNLHDSEDITDSLVAEVPECSELHMHQEAVREAFEDSAEYEDVNLNSGCEMFVTDSYMTPDSQPKHSCEEEPFINIIFKHKN